MKEFRGMSKEQTLAYLRANNYDLEMARQAKEIAKMRRIHPNILSAFDEYIAGLAPVIRPRPTPEPILLEEDVLEEDLKVAPEEQVELIAKPAPVKKSKGKKKEA